MTEITLEHTHIRKELLPLTIQPKFPKGAVVVFADEEFLSAIPASAQQAEMLASLVDDVQAYKVYRDQLNGTKELSDLFIIEMEHQQEREDAIERNQFTKQVTCH